MASRIPSTTQPTPPATFALIWGLSSLALAAIDAARALDAVFAFALVASVVGVGVALADLLFDRRPGTTVFLLMGVPALLGAGLAGLDTRILSAVGLAVVGIATLGRVYGLPGEDDPETQTD
jgi:hypothetical protein